MREAVRRHRFACLFIGAVVAVLFLPALLKREVFTVRDHADYFQPLRFYTAVHIRDFVLPHWNPYSASGEPWLANPQTGVFYPPTWLFIALSLETAYMLYLALHLFILGFGAYLLFSRTVSGGAALVGAVAITFAGPTLSLLDVSNNLATFAWIPLVIWAAAARASPQVSALLLALAFLGGEPFFAAIAAALFVAVRAFSPAEAGVKGAEGRLRGILATALGAFGLAAIQLLPFLEMLRGSDRASGLSAAEIFRESMAPRDWLRIAVPPQLNAAGFDAALSQHFIPIIYSGIPVVALAVLAWMFVRKRIVLAWTALLLGSALVATGSHLPVGRLFEWLPLTLFRYPSRVVPFGALAIAALASLAWDRFRPNRRWADLILVLLVLADLVPRAAPLLKTAKFGSYESPYPAAAGRVAKIIRIHDGPLADRKAWLAGYVNLYQRRFDAETAAPVVSRRYLTLQDEAIVHGRYDLFALLSAGFLLSDGPAPPGLQPIATVRRVTMYVNPQTPAMATFWTWWRPAADGEAALGLLITEGMTKGLPVAGAPPPAPGTLYAGDTRAESLVLDTRHARVVVEAPRDGILVLSQQDAPGWRVYVDGMERRKLLAGGVFRAVAVPQGRHEVIWRWNPRSLQIGMLMTLITVVTLQTSTFVKRFIRRKFSS